jgi:hypothetical protein
MLQDPHCPELQRETLRGVDTWIGINSVANVGGICATFLSLSVFLHRRRIIFSQQTDLSIFSIWTEDR